jgi:hypothetical protein
VGGRTEWISLVFQVWESLHLERNARVRNVDKGHGKDTIGRDVIVFVNDWGIGL